MNPNNSLQFSGDSGIQRVRDMNQQMANRVPMSANAQSFTGSPMDRIMYENFATQKGAPYAAATSKSSTYQN